MACEEDIDCPGAELCYWGNLTWREAGAENSCACSSWYGFVGSDCDRIGYAWCFWLFLNVFAMTVSFAGMAMGVRALVRLYFREENKFLNSTVTTAVLATLSLGFCCGWRAVNLAALLSPDQHGKLDTAFSVKGEKVTTLHTAENVLAMLTAFFATLSALNVSLLWIEVANSSARLRHREVTNFTRHKWIVYLFEGLLTVIIIVLTVLNLPYLVTVAAAPFMLFIAVVFTVGQHRMTTLLRQMELRQAGSKASGGSGVFAGRGSEAASSGASSDDEGTDSEREGGAGSGLRASFVNIVTRNRSNRKPSGKSKDTLGKPIAGGTSKKSRAREEESRNMSMLRFIRNTSRRVVAGILLTTAAGTAYALMGLWNWKQYAPKKQVGSIAIVFAVLVVAIVYTVMSIQWYVYSNIQTRIDRIDAASAAAAGTRTGASNGPGFTNTRRPSFQVSNMSNVSAQPPVIPRHLSRVQTEEEETL